MKFKDIAVQLFDFFLSKRTLSIDLNKLSEGHRFIPSPSIFTPNQSLGLLVITIYS